MNQSKENMSRLSIGSNFPDISLDTTKGNIIKIPQDIKLNTALYSLLEVHGDQNALFSWKGTENIKICLIFWE